MLHRHRTAALAVLLIILAGCERAQRWPPAPAASESKPPTPYKDKELVKVPPTYGWLEPRQRLDIPLLFVAENSSEWPNLKDFWNELPARVGLRSWPLGLMPLEAAMAFGAQANAEVVKIKVPRGLPDPTAFIPAANPPTYGKWLLGKKLFFDKSLLVVSTASESRSCADCHAPATGYTLNTARPDSAKRNVPSLLNSVYNRHQFWDGRAKALEEVLQRQLDDQDLPIENPPSAQSPGYLHVFPGLVRKVGGKEHYLHAFDLVFGRDPTVDSIAKALATYMRTLLSGDSVYDRADENKRKRRGEALAPEDIEPVLSEDALKRLPSSLTPQEAAKQIARGYALFHGQAQCYACHGGPLFTDNGFHNVGIGESAEHPISGKEPGRFAFVPAGLKDRKLIGAFKTPTLRNLEATWPYMHDGSLAKLADVVAYFNNGLGADFNSYLDPLLLQRQRDEDQPAQAQRLGLREADLSALELFLRSLRGNDLPEVMTRQ
jgi:cytochrome c peroxidase